MPGLALQSPLLLAGLAAVLIPLAIHFLRRQTAKKKIFGTIRFLQRAIKKESKRIGLENKYLMYLRMLLIIILVLALAKPVITFSKTKLVKEGDKTAAVILIDTSFSMGCNDNGVIRLDRAKNLAKDVLNSIGPDDLVTLVSMGETADPVVSEFTEDHEEVADMIDSLDLSYENTNIAAGMTIAETMLNSAEAGNKEVYLFSDLQKNGWRYFASEKPESATSEASSIIDKDISLYVIDLGYKDTINSTITSVAFNPRQVRARQRNVLTFTAKNFGPRERNQVLSRLHMETGEETDSVVSLSSNGTTPIVYSKIFGDVKAVAGYLKLEEDTLPIDDLFYFVKNVSKQSNVLVLNGKPESGDNKKETFYLEQFLKIWEKNNPDGVSVSLKIKDVGSLVTNENIFGNEVVIMANIRRFGDEQAQMIKNYVSRGGNLILFFGNQVDKDNYNRLLVPEIIPYKIESFNKSPGTTSYQFYTINYDHPMLFLFRDISSGNLSLPRFWEYFKLTPEKPSTEEENIDRSVEIIGYSTGDPALLENRYGSGRVIIFTSSADTSGNDFPLHKTYLPFWSEVMGYLSTSGKDIQKPLAINQPVNLAIESDQISGEEIITVIDPYGEKTELRVNVENHLGEVYFSKTKYPGLYRVSSPNKSAVLTPDIFAINLPDDESNLTPIEHNELQKLLAEWRVEFIDEISHFDSSLGKSRKGIGLWSWLLVLAILALLVETIFANNIIKRG